MVVTCVNDTTFGATGTFGAHEPWPEWVDRFDLLGEGLIKSDASPVPSSD